MFEDKFIEVENKIKDIPCVVADATYAGHDNKIGVNIDQAIDLFNNGNTIYFNNLVSKKQWADFCSKTSGSGLVLMEMIPPTWEQPDRIRILWTVNHHMRWAQTLNRLSKGNFLFNRKIQDCSHKFISLAGRDEYDRIIFHQIFEAMAHSNDFLLYHSASEKKDLAVDKYGLNGVLQGTQGKRVEPFVDSNALEDNFPKLMPEFSKAEVAIVLTNWCLNEPNALSEKDLLAMAMGVPTYRVYSEGLRSMFSYWGFESQAGTMSPDLISETIEWTSTYSRLPNEVRQELQDNHGVSISKNRNILREWPDVLHQKFLVDWNKI